MYMNSDIIAWRVARLWPASSHASRYHWKRSWVSAGDCGYWFIMMWKPLRPVHSKLSRVREQATQMGTGSCSGVGCRFNFGKE